jgi:hypothetical protein
MREIRRINSHVWREVYRSDTSVHVQNYPPSKHWQFNTGTTFTLEQWDSGERMEEMEARQ